MSLLVFTLGNSSDAFLLVRAGELGVPVVMLPLLWCAFHIVKSAANWFAGGITDKIGTRIPIVVGWIFYAGIYVGFGYATASWQVWVLFLAYGFFYAITEPAEKKLVVQLVGTERRGLAFGWYHFTIGIASLPASLIFGWLYESYGPQVPFAWGAGLSLAAAMLLTLVRPREITNDL